MKAVPYILATIALFFHIAESKAEVRYTVGDKSILSSGKGLKLEEATHVEIYGKITEKDIKEIINSFAFIQKNNLNFFKNPIVLLNSRGGNLYAALKIGRFLREINAITVVKDGNECSSSCAFILLSGVNRIAIGNPKIGLHRFYTNDDNFAELNPKDAKKFYNNTIMDVQKYISEMGGSEQLIEKILSIPSDEVYYISEEEAEHLKIIGDDPAYMEYYEANMKKNLGQKEYNYLKKYTKCINSGISELNCRKLAQ